MKYVFITFYIIFGISWFFLFSAIPLGTQSQGTTSTAENTTFFMNETLSGSAIGGINRIQCGTEVWDIPCIVSYNLSLSNVSSEFLLINLIFVALSAIFLFILLVDVIIPVGQAIASLIPL